MTTSPENGPREDLSRFVQHTMRARGLSYRRLALRSIDPDSGERVSFQWLDKLATGGQSKSPDPWQLRALAAGLDVPPEVVKGLAARQWLDFEVAQVAMGPGDWALYVQLRGLPEEDKETLRVLVSEFVRRQEQHTPHTRTGEAPA